MAGHGLHGHEHAERRGRARVADTALGRGQARHPAGLLPDEVHVGFAGADVLGGDVAAGQAVDEAAEGPQQRFAAVDRRPADDDRLAAAQVEPGQRRLGRHALREAQHVP